MGRELSGELDAGSVGFDTKCNTHSTLKLYAGRYHIYLTIKVKNQIDIERLLIGPLELCY